MWRLLYVCSIDALHIQDKDLDHSVAHSLYFQWYDFKVRVHWYQLLNWSSWRSATKITLGFKLQWCINTVFTDACTPYFATLESDASSGSRPWWQRLEGGSKVILTDSYHFSHLLPLEFPLSLVGARACAPLLCLSDCLCFCMCAWVSTWMQIYMCACVCSLFQRFCNLRESQTLGLEQPPGLGSV